MTITRHLFTLLAAGLAAAAASTLHAQDYPARPIRLLAPFAPGGPMDILSRSLGERLAASLGKQIVVDNRSGGSGTIGVELVARAAPDGYTLLAGHSGTHVVNVSLFPRLPYDPVK